MKNSDYRITIKTLASVSGLNPQTIRTWENRYGAFTPIRSDGGQRLYDENDLNRAKKMAILIDKGQSISKIAQLSLKSLIDLHETLNDESESFRNQTIHFVRVKKLINHLANYNIEAIASEMHYLRESLGAKEFIFDIILPVMTEIGALVVKEKYTVTQEHIISTIVRSQLGHISFPVLKNELGHIALATPDGNLHEISILIADIICRCNRHETSYLGAGHPAECLAEAVNALKCEAIVLGVVSSDQWDYDLKIIKYLKKVDKFLKRKVTIILGGGHEKSFPSFNYISDVKVIKSFQEFDKLLAEGPIV